MSRDENAPEDVSEDITNFVDSRKESASRRRTVRGVDVELIRQEAAIASESRKNQALAECGKRAERWFVLGGAVAAYIVLGIELWRITSGS